MLKVKVAKVHCCQCGKDWRPMETIVKKCPYCHSTFFNSPEKRLVGRPKKEKIQTEKKKRGRPKKTNLSI